MTPISPEALSQLFHDARSNHAFDGQPVTDETLRQLYELVKLGPTANNTHPTRFVFVRSPEAKDRLAPALSPGNLEKTMKAPVTVIVAVDPKFHEQLPTLQPEKGAHLAERFGGMPDEKRTPFLVQNAGIETGFLIAAARALGLDAGPMGGFDKEKVDAAFFADSGWRSQLLVNLGVRGGATLPPRLPRLPFEVGARVL